MVDVRELILDRLVIVANTVTGIKTVVRNKGSISDNARPAILILDADEVAVDEDPVDMVPSAFRRVSLNPEVYIMLSAPAEDVGTTLNTFRAALIKAIMSDAVLISLTLDGTGIRYGGCATALALGRAMEGAMGLNFSFTYTLKLSDL